MVAGIILRPMPADPLVLVRDLELRHPGITRPVLRLASWALAPGEQVALTGPSGCGKSSLLHALAGFLAPATGRITIAGIAPHELPEAPRDRWRAQHLGVVFQRLNLLPGLTVREQIRLGARFTSGPHDDPDHLIDLIGLGHRRHHPSERLSVGEQQRVAVARSLIKRPALLLADEPTAALDPAQAQAMIDLLRTACTARGTALIVATHQPDLAAQFPGRLSLGSP